jgi:WD40 repeat protein
MMNVWQWDKKEPLMRFPLREQFSAFRTSGTKFCAGADKKGRLYLWSMISGELIADVENAHYLEVSDIDMNDDIIVTAGKDCKVKAWLITDLLKKNQEFVTHHA